MAIQPDLICENCCKKLSLSARKIRHSVPALIYMFLGATWAVFFLLMLPFVVGFLIGPDFIEELEIYHALIVALPGFMLFIYGLNRGQLKIIICRYCKHQKLIPMKSMNMRLRDLILYNRPEKRP